MSIEKAISERKEMGFTDAEIRASLFRGKEYSEEEINDLLPKGVKKSFIHQFQDWLVERPRTEAAFDNYIDGFGDYGETTDNVKKHKGLYKNTWDMAQRIHASQA